VRPQLAVYALVVCFLLVGGAALVVGAHDVAITSGTVGLTALSVVLLGTGIVLIVAAYDLVKLNRSSDWTGGEGPRSRTIVLAALLLTVFLGIYLFFAAIRTTGAQRLVVVLTALVLIVMAGLGLRYFGRHARLTHFHVEAAIALGVLGIVIGVAQFWFQNQYVPPTPGARSP